MRFNNYKDNKKGALSPQTIFAIFIIAIVSVFLVNWFMGFGGRSTQTPLVVQQGIPQGGQAITFPSLVEDITVTFSSYDAYAKATNAGTAHRILSAGDGQGGGDLNLQVNDDSTRTYSPGQSYSILLGNLTTGLGNAAYYPVYVSGTFLDKGTVTIQKGQYAMATPGEVTFAFFDEDDTVNTAQSISTSGKKTVSWKITAPDNQCIGNPDAGGDNLATYTYNSSVWSRVVQLNEDGSDKGSTGTPVTITSNVTISQTGKSHISYTYPVVCDNAAKKVKARVETLTGVDANTNDDINISMSDFTYDFNDDTLEIIKGYVDEKNNDLGFADNVVGNLIFT